MQSNLFVFIGLLNENSNASLPVLIERFEKSGELYLNYEQAHTYNFFTHRPGTRPPFY
jgi:hypothetical protein